MLGGKSPAPRWTFSAVCSWACAPASHNPALPEVQPRPLHDPKPKSLCLPACLPADITHELEMVLTVMDHWDTVLPGKVGGQ